MFCCNKSPTQNFVGCQWKNVIQIRELCDSHVWYMTAQFVGTQVLNVPRCLFFAYKQNVVVDDDNFYNLPKIRQA